MPSSNYRKPIQLEGDINGSEIKYQVNICIIIQIYIYIQLYNCIYSIWWISNILLTLDKHIWSKQPESTEWRLLW